MKHCPTAKRYLTLDAMRGLAALAVVYYHAWPLVDRAGDHLHNLRFGYLAVDLFFVLSGFVISHAYDGRFARGLTAWAFVRLRILRLWPTYLVGVTIAAAVALRDSHPGDRLVLLEQVVTAMAMLPSPTWRESMMLVPLLPVAWSLVAEFWVANVGFAFGWRRLDTRWLAATTLAGFVGLIAMLAVYHSADVGPTWSGLPALVARVVFSFSVGVLVQRWHHRWKPPSLPAWAILLVTAASFCPNLSGDLARLYELGCIVVLYPALIYAGAHAQIRSRVGETLGETSYALYVIHAPLLFLAMRLQVRLHFAGSQALALAFVCGAFALAYAVQLADLPARRWLAGRAPAFRRQRPGRVLAGAGRKQAEAGA